MIERYVTMEDVIADYEDRMLLEAKEKVEKDYTSQSLDHSVILISPEIDRQIESNKAFETVIKTALSEIAKVLDEEFHGKIGYIINISVARDYENPDWKVTEIEIKVPIDNPKYVLQLWDNVSDRVWDKVGRIEENAEEIEQIEDNTMVTFDILTFDPIRFLKLANDLFINRNYDEEEKYRTCTSNATSIDSP